MASQGPQYAGNWENYYADTTQTNNPWSPDFSAGTPLGPPDGYGVYSNFYSNILQTYNHNFTIPSGQIINGVVVDVTCMVTVALDSIEEVAQLSLTPGNPSASVNKADNTTNNLIPYQSYGIVSFGSPTDTWGLSLDSAKVNSVNFGFQFAVDGGTGGRNGTTPVNTYVDAIGITIYYSSAAPPPSTRNRIMV